MNNEQFKITSENAEGAVSFALLGMALLTDEGLNTDARVKGYNTFSSLMPSIPKLSVGNEDDSLVDEAIGTAKHYNNYLIADALVELGAEVSKEIKTSRDKLVGHITSMSGKDTPVTIALNSITSMDEDKAAALKDKSDVELSNSMQRATVNYTVNLKYLRELLSSSEFSTFINVANEYLTNDDIEKAAKGLASFNNGEANAVRAISSKIADVLETLVSGDDKELQAFRSYDGFSITCIDATEGSCPRVATVLLEEPKVISEDITERASIIRKIIDDMVGGPENALGDVWEEFDRVVNRYALNASKLTSALSERIKENSDELGNNDYMDMYQAVSFVKYTGRLLRELMTLMRGSASPMVLMLRKLKNQ